MTMTKGRDYQEYHGPRRLDCSCGKCTGEDYALELEDRKIKTWDEQNIEW